MKGIYNFMCLYKNTIVLSCIVFFCLLAIFPFLLLCQYNVPGASDDLWHAMNMTHRSYFDAIWRWYYLDGYNGRYANAFFMLIPGRIFMKPWFGVMFPIFVFVSLYASLWYMLRAVLPKESKIAWIVSFVLLAYMVSVAPHVIQFYWYSGATVYVIPAILYFLLLGMLIRYFDNPKVIHIVAFAFLLFFITGSNENWAIVSFLTMFMFAINNLLQQKLTARQWIVCGLTLLFFVMIIFAPGSSRRLAAEPAISTSPNADLVGSLGMSIFHITEYCNKWFFNIGAMLLFCGCFLFDRTYKRPVLGNVHVILLIALFFIILYSGILVLLFSLGHFEPIRQRGMMPIFMVEFVLFALIIVKAGETWRKTTSTKVTVPTFIQYFILLIGLVFVISSSTNVKNAYSDIISGNAKLDAEENLWVQNYLMNSEEEEITIPQIQHKSKTLYYLPIPTKNPSWDHWLVTTYFHKKNIYVDTSMTMEAFRKQHSYGK